MCPCVRTHLRPDCSYAYGISVLSLALTLQVCFSIVVSLVLTLNEHTRSPLTVCPPRKRSLVYSHILALTYDIGSNFNDACIRLIDFNLLHFAKFWISFCTFDILQQLPSQQSWNRENRTTFHIFAILLSLRKKSTSGPIIATQALLCREFRESQM